MTYKRVYLDIPEEVHRKGMEYAHAHGKSFKAWVAELIESALTESKKNTKKKGR